LKEFGVVNNMFKQNIKKRNKNKLMRHRRKNKKNKLLSVLSSWKEGMCAGKKKCKK